jgi:hypothetical protein
MEEPPGRQVRQATVEQPVSAGGREGPVSTIFSDLGPRTSDLGPQHSDLSTRTSALSTQHSALSTQHSALVQCSHALRHHPFPRHLE